MRTIFAFLSVALLAGVGLAPAQAQGAAPSSAQAQTQGQMIDQSSAIYQALQTVDRAYKGIRSAEAGGADLPATLTREQAARYLVTYISRLYIETPTATFTTLWQTQPETFNALRTLATELGTEAMPRAGVTTQMVANVARTPFPDVPRNHWAAGAVERLRVHGIVVGYPDGTYSGGNLVK